MAIRDELLEPLLNEEVDNQEIKKLIAKRAHESPELPLWSDNGLNPRVRGRSLSALTDEYEFNPVRKMNPKEYTYLHLWGENLENSGCHDDNLEKRWYMDSWGNQ